MQLHQGVHRSSDRHSLLLLQLLLLREVALLAQAVQLRFAQLRHLIFANHCVPQLRGSKGVSPTIEGSGAVAVISGALDGIDRVLTIDAVVSASIRRSRLLHEGVLGRDLGRTLHQLCGRAAVHASDALLVGAQQRLQVCMQSVSLPRDVVLRRFHERPAIQGKPSECSAELQHGHTKRRFPPQTAAILAHKLHRDHFGQRRRSHADGSQSGIGILWIRHYILLVVERRLRGTGPGVAAAIQEDALHTDIDPRHVDDLRLTIGQVQQLIGFRTVPHTIGARLRWRTDGDRTVLPYETAPSRPALGAQEARDLTCSVIDAKVL